jgi:exodeoxyribonuclease VII large subunit
MVMNERKVFTLLQLSTSLQKRIEEATRGGAFWIKAEIAGINSQRHIYLELVEHSARQRVAVMRGIIWQPSMRTIRAALGDELPHVLKEGAEILFKARVHYHPVYGMALHIEEVDLAYSLGELERRKQEAIATLRAEGVYDLNRALPEPMVIQRIALITSIGSAAHSDFVQHLLANDQGYRFHVKEFPSLVQGPGAAAELRHALGRIDPTRFDALVLIRGGGSKLDLDAFNDLELCRMLARMPIPVMTGIGHDVDVSVVDLIAKSPHKTPTAVADHLIDKCLYFETSLNGFLVSIQRVMSDTFSLRKEGLSANTEMLRQRPLSACQMHRGNLHTAAAHFARMVTEQLHGLGKGMTTHTHDLSVLPLRRVKQLEDPRLREMRLALDQVAQRGMRSMLQRVDGMREAIQLLDPDKVLARGFSITRHQGTALTDPAGLRPGDIIETTFATGRTRSTINTVEAHGRGKDDL